MPLTSLPEVRPADAEAALAAPGRLVLILPADKGLPGIARRIDRATKGAVGRALASPAWAKLREGDAMDLAFPAGLAADALQLVKLAPRAGADLARRAGAAIGKSLGKAGATVLAAGHPQVAEIAQGLTLRAYDFGGYKTGEPTERGPVTLMVSRPDQVAPQVAQALAVARGVALTRDLINEPANVLTTSAFASRLEGLRDLGLTVEVLDEAALEAMGMRALLGVGQGSESPSKVVVMEWKGGDEGAAPFALVGKGVCFDTGGISLKPAEGMQDMTMDMGGAGVVAGVMMALALTGARTNVVGLVGLVENMPDGRAQRPGDVVRSMKGDTIEIINTDAEGRLVLADVLWYAQERFRPRGMINLATLTGAVVVALGHENAGVFSNNDPLCAALIKAAGAEGEGAWRLPLAPAYDAILKSHIADMRNSCGRPAGSITAAQFLKRFVRDDTPWCHIDIAGVAVTPTEGTLHPAKGASGWGVRTLVRLMGDLAGNAAGG